MSDISKTLDECTRMLHQMIEIQKENSKRLTSIENNLSQLKLVYAIKRAYLLHSITEEYQLDEQSFYDTDIEQ